MSSTQASPFSDGVERVVGSRRQRSIVGVDHANPKDSGGSSMIMLHFGRPLILPGDQASSPGEPGFSEQHRDRWTCGAPSFRRHVESLQPAVHAVPVRRNSDNHLGDRRAETIFGLGKYGKNQEPYRQPKKKTGMLGSVHGFRNVSACGGRTCRRGRRKGVSALEGTYRRVG